MSHTQQIFSSVFEKMENMALFLIRTEKPDTFTQIFLAHSDSMDGHFVQLKTYPNIATVGYSAKEFIYIPSDVDVKKYVKIVKSENVPIIFEVEFDT